MISESRRREDESRHGATLERILIVPCTSLLVSDFGDECWAETPDYLLNREWDRLGQTRGLGSPVVLQTQT